MHVFLQLLLTVAFLFFPTTLRLQQNVPVTPFDSLELSNGGNAILRHGPTHRVTLIKGSLDHTQITTLNGRLIVNKCKAQCPRGYELEVEIISPRINGVSLSHGGRIESVGKFPAQTTIAAAVSNGGAIDIRSITADSVSAAIAEGGAIFTRPRTTLAVTIANGGNVTFWGDPSLTRLITGGGMVTRGATADADKPMTDLCAIIPPLPPVPSVPTIRNQ